MATPIDNGGKTDSYVWTQTAYDLAVTFSKIEELKKKDIVVTLTPSKFLFKHKNNIVFEGDFPFSIKVESSTWFIEDNSVVVELDKHKKHEWWKTAFVGQEEIDTSKVTPASETYSDLDSSTKATIDKMLYEQEMKEKNKAFINTKP